MRVDEAAYFANTLQAATLVPSTGCVLDEHVGAGANLDPAKMRHKHRKTYAQAGTAVAATVPLHVVVGATAVVKAVKVGSIVACTGDATLTVDVKKNGTTILSAVVTLNSANTARVVVAGTVSVTAAVVGDFFEVVVAVSAGTGALAEGLAVEFEIDEAAQ